MSIGQDLDCKIADVMANLSFEFKDPKPAHIVHTLFLRSKLDLYELWLNKLTNYISNTSPQLGNILEHVVGTMSSLYKEFPDILNEIQPKFQTQYDLLKSSLEKAMTETSQVLEAAEHLEL